MWAICLLVVVKGYLVFSFRNWLPPAQIMVTEGKLLKIEAKGERNI